MKFIVVENYDEMSKKAAEIMADTIKAKNDCVLGLATGSTPEGLYAELIGKYESGELDFSKVRSVNLDEYYPLAPDNDQSYRYFMNEKLFDKVNIDKANTYIPDGLTQDVEGFCASYDAKIEELGGIDVQVLGVGINGHIGFNEPDAELVSGTHLTTLTPNTIKANSRFFSSEDDVPKHALTMGMGSVFAAKKLLLLASGENKADAIAKVASGKITTSCPASFLCLHHDVVVICDKAAYSKVK